LCFFSSVFSKLGEKKVEWVKLVFTDLYSKSWNLFELLMKCGGRNVYLFVAQDKC